jgi:hypothetical protein
VERKMKKLIDPLAGTCPYRYGARCDLECVTKVSLDSDIFKVGARMNNCIYAH